jgi:hypothetical protein
MAEPKLYSVAIDSNPGPDLAADTPLLDGALHTLDDIVAACVRHAVRARVVENGQLIGEFVPANERRARTAK